VIEIFSVAKAEQECDNKTDSDCGNQDHYFVTEKISVKQQGLHD